MYDNIGGKIKGLAKVICVIGIIVSVIAGLNVFADNEQDEFLGVLYFIIGPLLSWVGSFFLYGFGELIEKTSNIEQKTSNIEQIVLSKECLNSEYILEKFYKGGIITEEEYNRYKVYIDQKSK